MQLASTDWIKSGLWKEHASGRWYILVKDETATKISVIVSIALTLSLPRVLVIIKWIFSRKVKTTIDENGQEIEMPALTTHGAVIGNVHRTLSDESDAGRAGFRILTDYICARNLRFPVSGSSLFRKIRNVLCDARQRFQDEPSRATFLTAYSFFFFLLFASFQAIAISSTRTVGPNTARSSNPRSGAWFPDLLDSTRMHNTSIFPALNDLQTDLMFKAVAYADHCYRDTIRKDECSSFYTRRITYDEKRNAPCPFAKHMCLEGPDSAYELDTGWTDAKDLGVNEKHTCHFRLRKTCSPLVADDRYVHSASGSDPESRHIEYFYGDGYGNANQGNLTFSEEVRDPTLSRIGLADYIIREINGPALKLPNVRSPRRWIPDLHVPNSKVSLYFIRPVNLEYVRPSYDPIFPATIPSGRMAGGDILYTTPHQRSTVLACADSIVIRHPASPYIEWHPRYQNLSELKLPEWQKQNVLSSLHIVNVSYLSPSFFSSRSADLSEYFNARRRIHSFHSSPLDSRQTEFEIKKMFNTTLALLQFQVLGIAQGLGHEVPLARNLLTAHNVDARGTILFPASDWKNIKLAELLVFIAVCIGLWVFTIEVQEEVDGVVDAQGLPRVRGTLLVVSAWKKVLIPFWTGSVRPQLERLQDVNFNKLCNQIDRMIRTLKERVTGS